MELTQKYEEFKESVIKLRLEILGLKDYFNHPSFLGEGDNKIGFIIKLDSKEYVVKFYKNKQLKSDLIIFYNSININSISQMIAYSIEDSVGIYEYNNGEKLSGIGLESLHKQHILNLIRDIILIFFNEISFDYNVDNFLFNKYSGVSYIDLNLKYNIDISNIFGDFIYFLFTNLALNSEFNYDTYLRFFLNFIIIIHDSYPPLFNLIVVENNKSYLQGKTIIYNTNDTLKIKERDYVYYIIAELKKFGLLLGKPI